MASRRIDVHRAVERGDLAVLTRYLEAGGDVEKKDTEYGAAPVHWASLRGRVDALSLLFEHGAGLESRTGTDGTPLVWGCMGGDAKVVLYLLEKGADIDAITKGKGTALHHATNSGHPEVVAILLENGADPNAQDNRGERPGDRFDPEVSDAVRRAITKVLAKAKGEGPATKGPSRSKTRDQSRGRASIARKPRSSDDKGSSSSKDNRSNGVDHERGDGHRATSGGWQRGLAGWEQVRPMRSDSSVRASAAAALSRGSLLPLSQSGAQSEEDLISAAEASIAAAAWTPTAADRKSRLTGKKESSSRTGGSDRKRNGSGADRGTASSAAAQSNGHSSATPAAAAASASSSFSSAAAAAAAAANVSDQPLSSRSARPDPADGAATVPSLQRRLWSLSASATDPELDDLRRQIKDHALAVTVAEKRDTEGRLALRQALAESEKRAEGVRAAAQARLDRLDVLVQTLERRLCERDDQVKSLKAEVIDQDARLRQAEQEVTSLRAQLKGLSDNAVTPAAHKPIDAPLGELSTPSRLPSADRDESKRCTRTQSSPALSPRISASLRQLASAVDAGGEGAGGGVLGIGGGIENSPSLNRRSTVGPGSSPADESFTSPAGVAGTGTGTSKAGVLGWWKRNDSQEDDQAANKDKPRPINEDQERLGNLYSMIARR